MPQRSIPVQQCTRLMADRDCEGVSQSLSHKACHQQPRHHSLFHWDGQHTFLGVFQSPMWWKFAWYTFWGNEQNPFWVLQTTFDNPHLEGQKLAWTNLGNWLGQKKTSHVLLLQWVQPGLLLLSQGNKQTPQNEPLLQPPLPPNFSPYLIIS